MHTAGLGELVALSLDADVKARILYADESSVMISTNAPSTKLGQLAYVKNCFAVLGSVPRRHGVRQAVENIAREIPKWSLRRTGRPYRLMFSEDGQLVGLPGTSRSRLQQAVSNATAGRFAPRGGGDEYWAISRRDLEEVLFCRRLDRQLRLNPPKGGLAPDLAQLIVNSVGRAHPDDVILDPFAGTGALISARIRRPFREAICSDLGYRDDSVDLLPGLKTRAGVRKLTDDARTLSSIPNASVDVVLTDPPWGEFDDRMPSADALIAASVTSIRRVLRPDGHVAMLVSRRLAKQVTTQWAGNRLKVRKSYDILVNGHPASVLVGLSDDPPNP